MTNTKTLTAALLIIGNEILSGRTQDINAKHIAEKLGLQGIGLSEIRVVPDVERRVIHALNDLRIQYDYIFTTGGIGPTHDDITAECVAKSFGVALEENKQALEILIAHYGAAEHITPPRRKMAMIPHGGNLIKNPVSGAPGFSIGNVYVMAGVPKIMQAMLDNVLPTLKTGAIVFSNTIGCDIPESRLAEPLGALQKEYPDIDMGSYPRFVPGAGQSVSLVLRSANTKTLKLATDRLLEIISGMTQNVTTDFQVQP